MFRKLRAEAERENVEKNKLMFDNRALFALLLPIIIEQILNSFMGMVDTVMVSNVDSAAISAVSLVDSISNLMIYIFSAMATGGAVVAGQYIGSDKALSIALTRAGLGASQVWDVKVEFDTENGVPIYEVEFKGNGKEFDAHVHAVDSNILKWEVEVDD